MKAAVLSDRGVIRLSGEDAKSFLNGLVTTDVLKISPEIGRFGALLTPQGKIVADFLMFMGPKGELLIDCPRALAAALAGKLQFYKLRAKVTVENLSDDVAVLAIWDGTPAAMPDMTFADPRHPDLGFRIITASAVATASALGVDLLDDAAYEAKRIAIGVPRGGSDFQYGDAFPHDANMDRLAGVDFDKGCYVGQEVVSRMQHRGTARTRIVRVAFQGPPPAVGSTISAGDKTVGTMGSAAQGAGLALLRIDRAADAVDAGLAFSAAGTLLHLVDVADVRPVRQQTIA